MGNTINPYICLHEKLIILMNHNKYTAFVLSFILLLAVVLPISATKRALLIGIGVQQDDSWGKINGDRDIAYLTEILKKSGYAEIDSLKNEQATKKGIVNSLIYLAKQSQPGDVVFISFSGHGQQMTDINGDESDVDELDETWIPYDAKLKYSDDYRGENHLVDDELNGYLKSIYESIGEEGKMLVLVDACHAGGSTRGSSTSANTTEIVRGVSDVFMLPMLPDDRIKSERSETLQMPWLTLSACLSYQKNFEMASPKVGRLTYTLYSLFEKGISFEEIYHFMNVSRSQSRLKQYPQLEGDTLKYNLKDFFEYAR